MFHDSSVPEGTSCEIHRTQASRILAYVHTRRSSSANDPRVDWLRAEGGRKGNISVTMRRPSHLMSLGRTSLPKARSGRNTGREDAGIDAFDRKHRNSCWQNAGEWEGKTQQAVSGKLQHPREIPDTQNSGPCPGVASRSDARKEHSLEGSLLATVVLCRARLPQGKRKPREIRDHRIASARSYLRKKGRKLPGEINFPYY